MNQPAVRKIVAAIGATLVAGCASAPGTPNSGLGAQLRQTFASDDPCSNSARNIGIVGGAVLGALLGNAMGGGKNDSKLIGAALGGVVGGLVGADLDRKRCELSKVAKKYDLDISFASIASHGEVTAFDVAPTVASAASDTGSTAAVIGNTVTVRDKDGVVGHFETGSDQLTARAREYFAAIATQYSLETALAAQIDPRRKDEVRKQMERRHVLLIGHSDDTGPSKLNADLSERRARAVAAFLKEEGVPEANIWYQGAGDTLPIAENHTEAGRAANRRVEIVEVADESGFKKYLETRKPKYAFYRTEPSTSSTAQQIPSSAAPATQASSTGTKPLATKASASSQTIPAIINFGGVPYSPTIARIETGLMQPERGFNLISKAHADDTVLLTDCSYDRPRTVGAVKSLRDGSNYKTTEHLPQLYGKTWASIVNGNLVLINHLSVLRATGAPANLPELKVYAQYKPGHSKKAEVNEEPAVNSYLVNKGVLYRMFPRGDGGLKCVDVLFGADGATTAKAGKLIYVSGDSRYVADFKPQLQ